MITEMKRLILLISTLILLAGSVGAQVVTQTIRGRMIDQDSRATLIGANITVLGSEPLLGASTDMDGNFRIENVPIGRVNLSITYIGYEDKIIPNVVVGSAKEVVLEIELAESVNEMEAVHVTATKNKAEVLNEMAMISAKSFTVEETSRYAGAISDPARMVSSFAGVTGDATGNNDIVVRGNSSKGIQWRLEGIEIPNPNHFADEGQTGGPINALNSAMLSNSDFFTGAFAPEYGNAYSGVFDMRLRTGNNQQREYGFGFSVLGIDFTAEGPFKKGGQSSYLANYRYSSLALLDQAGIVDFSGVPKYQDGSFKLFFPTKKAGTFSVFGLGGISGIFEEIQDTNNAIFSTADYWAKMGVAGINHTYLFNDKTYLKSSVSLAGNSSGVDYEELRGEEAPTLKPKYNDLLEKTTGRVATTLHHKFNAKHKLQVGGIYSLHRFNFLSEYYDDEFERFQPLLKNDGDAGTMQAFVSWKYRITEDLTLVTGAHYMQFMLNDAKSFEPRAGLSWAFKKGQSINAGFGVHSKLEPLTYYFALQTQDDGSTIQPNTNLGLSKARHYVLGYDNMLTHNLHMHIEAYYQEMYDVPIENVDTSSFSSVNMVEGWVDRSLVNEGTGRNYGVELTLERFFANRYFFLVTGSLYKSLYTAKDGIERNSRFDGNYAANFLFGKEFVLGNPDKNRTLGISGKVLLMGGYYYTPIDLQKSIEENNTVFQEDNPLSKKGDDVFQANLALTYRKDRKKTTHEFKIDVQNVTNNQATTFEYFDDASEEIVQVHQLSILPVISYKIEF